MRTTIRLPDELYTQVRRGALDDGTTVTTFIEQALREALARRSHEAADSAPYRVRPFAGRGLQPGVDLTDSVALLDLMDSR